MLKRDESADPNSCWNRARDDEWTFVLLGRDIATPDTIRDWARRRVQLGKNTWDDAQIKKAIKAALLIEAEQGCMDTAIYRVIDGSFKGALVRSHFINSSGNADCRFAETFRVYGKGEIVVLPPDCLLPVEAPPAGEGAVTP
jgi:hypothetical protein